MIHNVTIDRPEEEKSANQSDMMLQYGVDLSLYPRDVELNFMVRKSLHFVKSVVICHMTEVKLYLKS